MNTYFIGSWSTIPVDFSRLSPKGRASRTRELQEALSLLRFLSSSDLQPGLIPSSQIQAEGHSGSAADHRFGTVGPPQVIAFLKPGKASPARTLLLGLQ